MIVYAVERWRDIKVEVLPLLERHWEEVALDKEAIPLDIDYASYEALDDAGVLHIVTVRKNGELIGYYWAIVRTHLHYHSTLFAFTDIFYVAPEHRKGLVGYRLFVEMEKTLVAMGVKKIFAATKTKRHVGPIFDRLGYEIHEIVYSKLIG